MVVPKYVSLNIHSYVFAHEVVSCKDWRTCRSQKSSYNLCPGMPSIASSKVILLTTTLLQRKAEPWKRDIEKNERNRQYFITGSSLWLAPVIKFQKVLELSTYFEVSGED